MKEVHQQRESIPQFSLIPPEQVKEHWGVYGPMIRDAIEQSLLISDHLGAVYERLLDGGSYLAQINTYDDLLAVAVLEIAETTEGRVLHVHTLTGDEMDFWIEGFIGYLGQLASQMQCFGITCTGRMGWQKALKQFGFVPRYVTMKKEVQL